MLNEEKIILMTKMAAFDEVEGKRDFSVHGYFRGDYISFQLLKSAIYATFGCLVVVLMYILYDLENFLEDFYKMDVMEFVQGILSKYIVALVIYLLVSYFIYAYRYGKSRRRVKGYAAIMRELKGLYDEEDS